MTIEQLIADFNNQLQIANQDINKLEAEFADVKLNPYGVTKVDFEQRYKIREQILRLEGAIEGLILAKTHCEELGGTWEESVENVQDDLS
jgi:hypothetical protein